MHLAVFVQSGISWFPKEISKSCQLTKYSSIITAYDYNFENVASLKQVEILCFKLLLVSAPLLLVLRYLSRSCFSVCPDVHLAGFLNSDCLTYYISSSPSIASPLCSPLTFYKNKQYVPVEVSETV